MMRGVITIHTMEKTDRQQRRLQGEAWLYQAVAVFGYPDVTPENCPIERTEKGKPFFPKRPDIHFSISHSGKRWACVVADQPVGLDLQYHKEGRLDQIAPRFFHPDEAAWLERQKEYGKETAGWRKAFFDVWAAKESYVKWTGQGIDREFSHFSVVGEDGLISARRIPETSDSSELSKRDGRIGAVCFEHLWVGAKYSLCLCAGAPWDCLGISASSSAYTAKEYEMGVGYAIQYNDPSLEFPENIASVL